jgi:hypothetical protein
VLLNKINVTAARAATFISGYFYRLVNRWIE